MSSRTVNVFSFNRTWPQFKPHKLPRTASLPVRQSYATYSPPFQFKERHRDGPSAEISSSRRPAMMSSESSDVIQPVINRYYDHTPTLPGTLIEIIDLTQLKQYHTAVSSSTGFEELCAFSKTNTQTGSIRVPGVPPLWVGPDLPVTITNSPPDSCHFNQGQNLTCFNVLSLRRPTINFETVDVFAYHLELVRLYNMVRSMYRVRFNRHRFEFCMIRNTLFLGMLPSRVSGFMGEKTSFSPDMVPQNAKTGFRLEIVKALTIPEPGLEDANRHYRVIRYQLGDLNCVVQFQVDAHVPFYGSPYTSATARIDTCSNTKSKSMENIGFRPLQLIPGGYVVPSSALLNIQYPSKSQSPLMKEVALTKAWFNRISRMVLVPYPQGRGTITSVEYLHTADYLSSWEIENRDALRKLTSLLTELRNIASTEKDSIFNADFYRHDGPKLQINKVEGSTFAPPETFVKYFWR